MQKFCETLPEDRILRGSEGGARQDLFEETDYRKYIEPKTGAVLNYNSCLVILAHFVSRLPFNGGDDRR